MPQQVSIDGTARTGRAHGEAVYDLRDDVAYQRLAIVNVVFVGAAGAGDRQWILIDTGIPGLTGRIRTAAAQRFGEGSRPAAIVLTHGHFDHVGGLKDLAREWDAPIYAHEQELPFLNGSTPYPPADPSVGGGLMAFMSPLYPRGPIDVSEWLQPLPADGSVPPMPGWNWRATPGHSPGHVSFWRTADRTLLAGDAFVTTQQESAVAVALQFPEVHGPPRYYTPDWKAARSSVEQLAALEPELAVTGHGPALHGLALRAALHTLADHFDQVAVPEHGIYV